MDLASSRVLRPADQVEGAGVGETEGDVKAEGRLAEDGQLDQADAFAWMSQGGREEKAPKVVEKKVVPTKGKKK